MTAATAEPDLFEDLEKEFDEIPLCGALDYIVSRRVPCDKPSVVRVKFDCGACGLTAFRFLCEHHYNLLVTGFFGCRQCHTWPAKGLNWRVV